MQANWSLILNVLLLIGVIVAIGRLMKARRQSLTPESPQLGTGAAEQNSSERSYNDEIIAVRKINSVPILNNQMENEEEQHLFKNSNLKSSPPPRLMPLEDEIELRIEPRPIPRKEVEPAPKTEVPSTLMMFLLAKENRQFAGYELLQTVLAAGLRFGEGHLFHRHQFSNGQGPILCSLAAATATGVFDLQNIGAFSVRGLCLYMHSSKNPGIDIERFAVMLETARQLSEGLDAYLLDDQRRPLTEERIARYHGLLHIKQPHAESVTV